MARRRKEAPAHIASVRHGEDLATVLLEVLPLRTQRHPEPSEGFLPAVSKHGGSAAVPSLRRARCLVRSPAPALQRTYPMAPGCLWPQECILGEAARGHEELPVARNAQRSGSLGE